MIRAYFEMRYLLPDPWHLGASAYERQRAETTLELLSARYYGTALEVGCGEGIFTARLLERCDRIVAVDFSTLALRRARRRHAPNPRVETRQLDVLAADPGGTYDLVVCAELFYYMNRAQFEATAGRVVRWVALGGDLCLVHGTSVHDTGGHETSAHGGGEIGGSPDGRTGARQIHDRFCQMPGLGVLRDLVLPEYRLTLLRRRESLNG